MTPRRPVRGLAALVLAAALAASQGRAAAGEPLPADARARAEEAWVWGRLDELDAILGTSNAPVDLEGLAVRDLFWRGRGAGAVVVPPAALDGSLPGRRLAWLQAWAAGRDEGAPYPLPRAGDGEDAWPKVTALVVDRLRRERGGAAAKPVGEALSAAHDDLLDWFVKDVMQPLQGTPTAAQRAAPDPGKDEAHAISRRNRWMALAALAVFTGLGYALGLLARGGRGPDAA